MNPIEAYVAADAFLDEVELALTEDELRALWTRTARELEGPARDFVRGRIMKRRRAILEPSPATLRAVQRELGGEWIIGGAP